MRSMQKDTAIRLADALDHGRRMELDLRRSASDNRLFQEVVERAALSLRMRIYALLTLKLLWPTTCWKKKHTINVK